MSKLYGAISGAKIAVRISPIDTIVPVTSMKRWMPCDCRYGAAILAKMLPRRGAWTTGALSSEPVTLVVAVT